MKYEIKTPALIKHMYPEWWKEKSSFFIREVELSLDNGRVIEINDGKFGKEFTSPQSITFCEDFKIVHLNEKDFDIIVMGPYIPKGAEVVVPEGYKRFFNCWVHSYGMIKASCYEDDFSYTVLYDNCELYTEPEKKTRPYHPDEILEMVISGEWFYKDTDFATVLITSTDSMRHVLNNNLKIHKRGWPIDKWVDPVKEIEE